MGPHSERRRRIRAWVAYEVMPHERKVRAWLGRRRLTRDDIDEVIQDSYCRFAMLESVDHILHAEAYFFSTVRNLLTRKLKRAKIVPFEALRETEIERFADEAPSPERHAAANDAIDRIRSYMAMLPERCRTIVELRKFEDLSQKDIAQRLGVSESIVENDLVRGMRTIQQAWRDDCSDGDEFVGVTGRKEFGR